MASVPDASRCCCVKFAAWSRCRCCCVNIIFVTTVLIPYNAAPASKSWSSIPFFFHCSCCICFDILPFSYPHKEKAVGVFELPDGVDMRTNDNCDVCFAEEFKTPHAHALHPGGWHWINFCWNACPHCTCAGGARLFAVLLMRNEVKPELGLCETLPGARGVL